MQRCLLMFNIFIYALYCVDTIEWYGCCIHMGVSAKNLPTRKTKLKQYYKINRITTLTYTKPNVYWNNTRYLSKCHQKQYFRTWYRGTEWINKCIYLFQIISFFFIPKILPIVFERGKVEANATMGKIQTIIA